MPASPRLLPLVLLLPTALAAGSAANAAVTVEPVLELSGERVLASGSTPGGQVLLYGFAHTERDHVARLVRWQEVVEDADLDGAVELELGEPVPAASVWVVVDLATGASSVTAPEGALLGELDLQPEVTDETGGSIFLNLPMVEVLLVRPGAGAWSARLGDGGESDDDGVPDGTVRAALARMWEIGDSGPPPDRLAPADVLVLLDPNTLRLVVLRLAA